MVKPPAPPILVGLLLALVYFAAGKIGLSLALVNESASSVWAPTGIALAALLVWGYRLWPAIFIGAFLVNVTTSGFILSSLSIAGGNTLEALAGAYLVNRFARGRYAFERGNGIFISFVVAVFASTAVCATIGVATLAVAGLGAWDDFRLLWTTWWLGDSTGAFIVTPVIVLWANSRNNLHLRHLLESAFVLLSLMVVGFTVFGGFSGLSLENYPVEYLILPFLVWCAFRLGPRETASATLILSSIAVWGTHHGFGPFASYAPNEGLLLLLGFMSIVAMTSLSLAVVVAQRRRVETALRDREEQYRIVTETAMDAIVTIDENGIVTFANRAAEKIFGYSSAELVGKNIAALIPGYPHYLQEKILVSGQKSPTRGLFAATVELWGLCKGEREILLEISFSEFNQDGKHLVIGVVRDISERRRAEESQRWLATIVENSSDAIIGKSMDGTIVSWNEAAERMYGYSAQEIVGRLISVLMPPERSDEMEMLLEKIRRGERIQNFETERVRKDGQRISVSLSIAPIQDAAGVIHGASTIARDITERKRTEERIRYLAQHDALTGLPNRLLLRDRIGQAIAQASRRDEKVAILFIDLDGFKHINDSLGHLVGDHLLRMAARRLQRCLREGDSIARLGGDEFVLSLPAVTNTRDVIAVTEKVLQALREPFLLDQHELHLSGSVGISLYPNDGEDVEALMRAADTAMYHAKEKGRDNFQFFTPRLNETAQRRLIVANRMHQALQLHEFVLEYQPLIDLRSEEIIAAEALIRWYQGELGLIEPAEFIPVAEETGLIVPIGEWVLREACAQLKYWRDHGHPHLRMAINLSPQQFRRAGFPELAASVLEETGLPSGALEMEITEGVLVAQSQENASVLERLVDSGVLLAVDDFGTGYSSLAYLQRFPVHTLKIDRSFVDGIGHDANDMAIVDAIVALAHSLHLNVVAEGVETAEQLRFLKMHGCLSAQGFYYSKPVSPQAFSELLGKSEVHVSGA